MSETTVRRLHVRQVDTIWGDKEWQCEAGQLDQPVGCERHHSHHWCDTCKGYYGVSHTNMHDGDNPHPYQFFGASQCACRPCKKASGRE